MVVLVCTWGPLKKLTNALVSHHILKTRFVSHFAFVSVEFISMRILDTQRVHKMHLIDQELRPTKEQLKSFNY